MGQVYDMIVIGGGPARIFWCSGRPLCGGISGGEPVREGYFETI